MRRVILLDAISTVQTLRVGPKKLIDGPAPWSDFCFLSENISSLPPELAAQSSVKKALGVFSKQKRVFSCNVGECRHDANTELVALTARSLGGFIGVKSIHLLATALCHGSELMLVDALTFRIAEALDISVISPSDYIKM